MTTEETVPQPEARPVGHQGARVNIEERKAQSINGWFGVAFLFMALRQWRSRPKHGETPKMPKWMEAIDKFTPARSFLFGALLSGVNPKNLALTLAAAASIAQAGLSTGDSAIAVAVFVVIGSLTVAGPVLVFLFGGERAAQPLASIKEFMGEHNHVIMMVVLLVLGAKLIGSGWPALSS